MKHLDLFSGIGGFALAIDKVWPDAEHMFCEIDPFCQEVLKKHWPNSKIHDDIKTLTDSSSRRLKGRKVSVRQGGPFKAPPNVDGTFILTGGFPCQPFSQAGRRKGKEDDRHLWPEMLRVIKEFKPTWIVGENVAGIVNMVLDEVCSDLEVQGYEVRTFIIPAVAVNAPHRRDRVWIIAHRTDTQRRPRQLGSSRDDQSSGIHSNDAHPTGQRLQGKLKKRTGSVRQLSGDGSDQGTRWNENWLEIATRLCRVDDGIPRRLDRTSRLKALGNAIVPQVAEQIFKVIKEVSD